MQGPAALLRATHSRLDESKAEPQISVRIVELVDGIARRHDRPALSRVDRYQLNGFGLALLYLPLEHGRDVAFHGVAQLLDVPQKLIEALDVRHDNHQ
jgi:hypothetical protein